MVGISGFIHVKNLEWFFLQIVDAPLDMKLDKSLNENIVPYLLQSGGVEVEMLSSNRKLTVQLPIDVLYYKAQTWWYWSW